MASTTEQPSKTIISIGQKQKKQAGKSPTKKRSRGGVAPKASLGTSLLILVVGSALIGLGTLAFLFYQQLTQAADQQIEETLSTQVNLIRSEIAPVEKSVASLAASGKMLHLMGVKNPETYKQLVFEHFKTLDLASAIGMGQAPNKLVPDRQWYYPYFYRDQPDLQGDNNAGQLVAGTKDILFSELFAGNNYPEKPYYKIPVAANEGVWIEPYELYGTRMTTYVAPFFANTGDLLGVTGADVNVTAIAKKVANRKVFAGAGEFLILSNAGKLLAYPPDPAKAQKGESYQNVPELGSLWLQVQAKTSGLIRYDGKIWAFQRLPGIKWLMIATVPESVVLQPVLLTTVGATGGVTVLLIAVVVWFVANLNRRLKPILDECDKLAEEKGGMLAEITGKDEIERLSSSFQNLIEQVTTNEKRIREEVSRAVQSQERLKQVEESQVETEFLENEVGGLLDVVSAMEDGDLTVEAEVSDRATGLVADTLNRLREQLAGIIANVLMSAQQVVHGTQELEALARTVALNTEEQAKSVAEGRLLTEQVALSAQKSAAQVNNANTALLTAQATITTGQVAIDRLTEGIKVLRTGSSQIVQRMKTLGEFVGLAEQFVLDQGQIASLTQVLAINATLVAARAAEQRDPKQFIGVAREFEAIAGQVNNLANQTNEGLAVLQQRTSQIQSVVSAIDTEVQQLSGLVAGFTSGVEESQTSFQSVQFVTEQVVKIGQEVNESSTEIASAAETTAAYMSEIATLAQQTAELTSSTRQQAEQMGTLADSLLKGIQFFRLPHSHQDSTDTEADVAMSTLDV